MIETILALVSQLYDLPGLIRLVGYTGLFAIVFAETGLLIGFFLPGDSLLITAGLFAASGDLDIGLLLLLLIPAAVIGDATGYFLGKRFGRRLFSKSHSFFFHPEHLKVAEEFYEKHGGRTIILARFVPIVRTFAPVLAGIAKMPYSHFAVYNITGAVLWIAGMTLLGYFLGTAIPGATENIPIVVLIIVLISFIPMLREYMKRR